MCDYVTILLPGETDRAAARAVFDRHGFAFRISDGPETRYKDRLVFTGALLTRAHAGCDCGSVLRANPAQKSAQHIEAERTKWRELLADLLTTPAVSDVIVFVATYEGPIKGSRVTLVAERRLRLAEWTARVIAGIGANEPYRIVGDS